MRVICFGDSNTWGYDPRDLLGGRYDCVWTEKLAELSAWPVINRGMNGRCVPNGAIRWEPCELFVVMLGSNDLLQGRSAAETASRMRSFLQSLQGERLLIAPPPMTRGAWVADDELIAQSKKLAKHYCALAAGLGIGFVDAGQWGIPLNYDGVHFAEEGHPLFAKRLYQHIKKAYAAE